MGLLSAVLESAAQGAAVDQREAAASRGDAVALAGAACTFAADIHDVLGARILRCQFTRSLHSLNYHKRRDDLRAEMLRLQSALDAFPSLGPDLASVYDEVMMAREKFEFSSNLADCTELLESANRSFERRRFREAAEVYGKMMDNLNKKTRCTNFAELVKAMREIVSLKRARCISRIVQQWRQRLDWTTTESNSGHVITLNICICDPENLQEILNALFASGRIVVEIESFAEFFIDTIAPALASNKCKIETKMDSNNINIKINQSDVENDISDVKNVIDNFILFFETVQSAIDCKWEDDRTVFSIFGQIARNRFFEILTNKFLGRTIPIHVEAAESYIEIASQIERFNTYLAEIRFSDEGESPLIKSNTSAYDLIYDKKCQKLLADARNLIKGDLQEEIMAVCHEQYSEIYPDELEMLKNRAEDRNVLDSPYSLAPCKISTSAKNLMKLIIDELEKTQHYPLRLGSKIISTVRNVFEMYYTLVPHIHKDVLDTNPLDLALFYNNCFYLAHAMLGHPWSKFFPKDFASIVNIQLADQVHNMRMLAILKFSTFMKSQQQFIEHTISDSELSRLEKVDSVGSDSELAIHECLKKLKNLQKNWQNILTSETYEKAMADLINCLCRLLVETVSTVKGKNIGENLAQDISVVFEPILNAVPLLFKNDTDYKKLSRHFSRLSEITLLLKCPMFTIANLWQSENSQLSKLFSCEEIKHLIRIMFPGSVQKSTVLNMIQ